MNVSVKEKHLDTIYTIRERVGGCFGIADGIFALHPCDEERAKNIRKLAKDNNVDLIEIEEIFLYFLYNKTKCIDHIMTEMKKIKKFFCKLNKPSVN